MIDYLTSQTFLLMILKMLIVFGGLMGAFAYLSLVERRVMAFVQMRPGPNRVGPFGLLQPIADGLKFLFKEQVRPTAANEWLYVIAPLISLVPALMSFAVIPFGPALQVTDLNVALLVVFAVGSLSVYGIVLGGWASNSKYPLIASMRSSAQMISYELSLTLSVVGVLMLANTLSLVKLVESQEGMWLGFIPKWNIFFQPVAFIIYMIAATAETNRLPFDLAESEQELVSGWHTEYSGMKFAMYMIAEYGNLTATVCIATILFFGGWNGPSFGPEWLRMILPTIWFVLKIAVFIFFYVLARSTVPRIRYDQLMRFGWKYMIPVALANILITSFLVAIS
jgi:NADH-quinone oxidoreductase subunit H